MVMYAADYPTIESLPVSLAVPACSVQCKEFAGEWMVCDLEIPEVKALPHRYSYPYFYLVQVEDQIRVVCVLRLGKKKYQFRLESDPCITFELALTDVCRQAAKIPAFDNIDWRTRFAERRPDLPAGSISFSNIIEVGKPRFVCTYRSTCGIWCSSIAHDTLQEAFDTLVCCVEKHSGKDATSLSELQSQLQKLVGSPLTLTGFRSRLPNGTKNMGLRAKWLDVDGTHRKLSTTGSYARMEEALGELKDEICSVLKEGPRFAERKVCQVLLDADIKVSDVVIEYRGTMRLICRIKVRGVGEVESNAAVHRTAAFNSALELITKKATKSQLIHVTQGSVSTSKRLHLQLMEILLTKAKQRWLEERGFLMGLERVNELDRRRLQRLSLFMAALDPLRKYELAPGQRAELAEEMVGEITKSLKCQQPGLLQSRMAEYLRVLGRCAYCDPGFRVKFDHRFIRYALQQYDSPSAVVEELLSERLLRREDDGFAVSTVGANLMEQAIRSGMRDGELGAALPTETLLALSIMRDRIATG